MAYLASRIILIIFQPLSLACLLMAAGFLAGMFGWRRWRALSFTLAFAILFAAIFTTTGSWALAKLENIYARPAQDPQSVGCMIVLGGAIEAPVIAARGGFEMNQAADRFIEALRLARAFPLSTIVVSGGDGSLSGTYDGDAAVARRFFAAFGVSDDRIISETESRTTGENVTLTKTLLAEHGLDKCLLVTSAYHMPRAVSLFAKQGIEVAAWPTDYRTSGAVSLGFDFTQPGLNAQLSVTAWREWMSIVSAYLTGRTLHLLPA